MTQTQRIIKYCTIAFAVFLIVSIFGGLYFGIGAIFSSSAKSDSPREMTEFEITGEVKNIEIDILSVGLTVKTGETLKAETDSEYVELVQNGDSITIKEKKRNRWISFNRRNRELILYLPEGTVLNDVAINAGAGKLEIDKLSATTLDLDLGAGKVDLSGINVTGEISVDGGAGEMTVKESTFTNADISMGAGELNLTANLIGNSKVDCGVGEVNIDLLGLKEDYKITVDKGIGEAEIDGESVSNGKVFGSGSNTVDIDGGVGSISVTFSE